MEYRIKVEVEKSGKKWYVPQKRGNFPFSSWRNFNDVDFYFNKCKYDDIELAKNRIQEDVNELYKIEEEKIEFTYIHKD